MGRRGTVHVNSLRRQLQAAGSCVSASRGSVVLTCRCQYAISSVVGGAGLHKPYFLTSFNSNLISARALQKQNATDGCPMAVAPRVASFMRKCALTVLSQLFALRVTE